MSTIYGYCRVSTKTQSLERQEKNIYEKYPDAIIKKEKFTGTKLQGRKELQKILNKVKSGDTIVFDEVSRMSRNADEGFALYKELFNKGINLVFLKEPQINTDTYRKSTDAQIKMTGDDVDDILSGINSFLAKLAEKQIRLAFDQAQAEVDHLHVRTREGMKAKESGKKISKARTGKHYETEKSRKAKEFILKCNRGFGGTLTNRETWEHARISKMTFYKYQKELIAEGNRSV